MYRLLAIDVDGTMLDSRNRVTERTKAALQSAEKAGACIVVATARPCASICGMISELELKDPYIIAGSGSSVWRLSSGEELVHRSFTPDEVQECVRFSDKYAYDCLAVKHDGSFYCSRGSVSARFYGDMFKTPAIPVDYCSTECRECCKVMLFTEDNPAAAELCIERLRAELGRFGFGKTWRNIIELYPSGISKESALSRAVEILKVPPAEVMAVGDDRVDMGMLNLAGLGVAMGNGDGDLKAAADFITLSNDEDGLAYAIEKFIL